MMRIISLRNIILAILLIAVVFVAVIFARKKNAKVEETNEPVIVQEEKKKIPGLYESDSYSFRLEHALNLLIEEESADRISVADASSTNPLPVVFIDVIKESGDSEVPFEQFVLDESRGLCSSLGTTTLCEKVNDLSSYTNKYGKVAQKFYLVLSKDGKETEKGPFYAFNLSENTPGIMSFILVRPPLERSGVVSLINEVADEINF